MLPFAATLLTISGVALLFGSWRESLLPNWAWNTLGWSAIASGTGAWSLALGPEFGPVVSMLLLPLVAWVAVGVNHRVREPGVERIQPTALSLPRFAAAAHHLGRFVLTVPLAGFTSILLAVVAARAIPWSETGRLAFVILAVPLIWGGFAWWGAAGERTWRQALVHAFTLTVCALVLYP